MARVLIVEDDKGMRELLQIVLEQEGWEVVGVGCFEEATRALCEQGFDLVVTDYELSTPPQDGLALLAYLKETHSRTPAILISGSPNDRLEASARELGAAGFFTKPFDIDLFLGWCRQVLASGSVSTDLCEEAVRGRSCPAQEH